MNDQNAETPTASQLPLYHYAVGTSLASILASGSISTEDDYYFSWMKPAVRCTTRSDWEPTSGLYSFDSRRRSPWLAKDETSALSGGLIRIRVKPESAPLHWPDFVSNIHMRDEDVTGFAADARKAGSDPADWFVSLGPIQRCHWLSVEVWHEGAWVNVNVNA